MEIAKTILEDEGIIITTAENGQHTVNIFNNLPENTFDAILMDVRMPFMDGLDATKAIRMLPRKDAATVPIIAMTVNAYIEDIQKTAEVGIHAHIAKPIHQETLFQVLRNIYSSKRKFRQWAGSKLHGIINSNQATNIPDCVMLC